jgi:RNA polymerase sigma factor (sigma-70 family)
MNDRPVPVAGLVRRARAGDPDAWSALVTEFQDVAAALAAGWSGDWAVAEDIAQDAFISAFLHLDDLADPQAFPAWFKQVVHSATTRRLRGERRTTAPSAADGTSATDPQDVVAERDEAQRLHLAVESLPERERAVVALHYLARLPYPNVAELLGISVSAAKKRALSARRRLKEQLPMAIDALSSARPSRDERLRDSVALFIAIRRHDHDRLRALLARRPDLAAATESWSKDEAMQVGLPHAERGTPLVRAVETGDLELVRVVLSAGAPTGQACGCAGAESALWTAVLSGNTGITRLLLAAGADPNAAAFAGATPLIVAAQRGHEAIAELLLTAGADPATRDAGGRTAADWSTGRRAGSADRRPNETLTTGVRAVDLFAPIRRGSTQWWPAAWELGQFALLTQIARALEPAALWQIGFATGPYDEESGQQWRRQFPVDTTLRITPEAPNAAERRARFEASVRAVTDAPGDKIVMVLTSPGHQHDVTVAVAQLVDEPSVLTTIVIEPATRDARDARSHRPEGFDAQVSFDPWRAARQLWPAVDALETTVDAYPSARHEHLADTARQVAQRYRAVDPHLELRDPSCYPEPVLAERAQAMHRYLAQPFALWEHRTGRPGESTSYNELLETVETLLRK